MATLTVVITYTGTLGLDEEVQSYTSGGTAYGSLTDAQVYAAQRLLGKAVKRASADKGSSLRKGNH
jgi:hypothetical protein